MIARVIAACVFASIVATCASPPPSYAVKRWNPASAVADAERDISSHNIRFAYIGGIASYAPGLPDDRHTWLVVLRRYPHLEIGPQGCDQDDYFAERKEYATRYNQRIWRYVSKHS
jgi:hypothetical protein